jgi:hypothetical protein
VFSPRELFVRAGGADKIAVFAISPVRMDIGGYGGASPRELFVRGDGADKIAVFAISLVRTDIGGYGGSLPRETTDIEADDGRSRVHAPQALRGQPLHRRLRKGEKLLHHRHYVVRGQGRKGYLPLGRG